MTPGFQPRIFPSSVENRNSEGPDTPSWLTTKSELPLNTVPVGAPFTLTTSGMVAPVPSYRVETLVPLSATHHGVVGPAARPQALTRFGSTLAAAPGTSETSLWTR